MKSRPLHWLILIPAGLVLATLAVWLWHTFGSPSGPEEEGRVRFETRTVQGVTFEVEYEPQESVSFVALEGRESAAFTRGREWLDFEDGVLAISGVAFRTPAPGDVVRWNLAGPLLINGEPQSPHPFQPRRIEAPGTDLAWEIRAGSPAPRDTLSVAWSRPGTLLTAHGDGTVRLWDAARPAEIGLFTPDPPKGARDGWGLRSAISPDGRSVAVANLHDVNVTLWDVASPKSIAVLPEPAGKVTDVRFLSGDWLLESRGGRLNAHALPPERGKLLDLGPVHQEFLPPLAVDSDTWTVARNDGKQVAAMRLVPLVFTLFEIPLGRVENVKDSGCLAIAPGGQTLAIFNGERTLALHETATGHVIRRLRWRSLGKPIQIGAITFSPDGKTLAIGDMDSLRLYDVESGRERCWVSTGWIRSLAYSPDGRTLAAGLRYGSGVRLWKTEDLWAKTEEN